MGEGLSINNIDITKEDVVITFTPSSGVVRYSYVIVKDNEYGIPININESIGTTITLNNTGTYRIEITTYDAQNISNIIKSGEYKIDKEAPILNIKEKTYKIKSNQEFDYMDGISASDIVDGDLTNLVTTNINSIDFNSEGIKTLEYSVSDRAGNTTTETVYVTVVKDNTNLVRFGQLSIGIIAILIAIFLSKFIRSIRLEKRFSKYTINSSKNSSISLFDNLYNQYIEFIKRLGSYLSKSAFIKTRAERYSKYNVAFDLNDDSNMKTMATKVVIGFAYVLLAAIVRLVQSTIMQPIEMIIPFIIGFYTLDVIYMYKYIKYRKRLENDMLQAITVMNNAFKAGRSIVQAVDLVSAELDGPIAKEFKRISMELSFGLDVEVVFKRFADRIKIPEAVYLTSSLSILNKTGGNIIKVFDSIEKTLYNRKKLQVELKSLTGSSKLIMYVLIIVPVAFVFLINLINKEYFKPMYSNPLGLTLLGIILLIYVTYIIVVRKVMKVRM